MHHGIDNSNKDISTPCSFLLLHSASFKSYTHICRCLAYKHLSLCVFSLRSKCACWYMPLCVLLMTPQSLTAHLYMEEKHPRWICFVIKTMQLEPHFTVHQHTHERRNCTHTKHVRLWK